MVELKIAENTLHHSGRQEYALVCGDEVVGVVDLFNYDAADQRAEFGLFIDPSKRGQGYGRVSAVALLDYCREVLKLHQLVCDIAVDNQASLSLFDSVGFTRCGILKEWTSSPQGWTDAVRMQKIL